MSSKLNIPGYLLEERLGGGAMADVYLATQESLLRPVALKILKSQVQLDLRERFIQEAHLIAAISHPSIITIYDIGKSPCGKHYIAMEYLQAGELRTLNTHYDEAQCLELLTKLTLALQEVHSRGIVHRDLKPANILLRKKGEPVLCDFGVAKDLLDNTDLTQAGTAVGTPAYISPEQALAKPVDHRSDLYSLGVILFEMLMGENPFRSGSSTQTFINHVKMPVPILPSYLEHWQDILNRLLAKKPSERFSSAEDLLSAIASLPAVLHSPQGAESKGMKGEEEKKPSENRVSILPLVSKHLLDRSALILSPLKKSSNKHRIVLLVVSVLFVAASALLFWPSKQDLEIRRLLEQAELTWQQKLISVPQAHNATYYFNEVLALEPENAEALAGIANIVEHHHNKAKTALAEKQYRVAFQHIRLGIDLDPDNIDLLALKKENSEHSNGFKRLFNKAKSTIIP